MDYSKAKIYKILNDITNDVYIGATCQSLSQRMAKHRKSRNAQDKKHLALYQKMNEIGVEHFYIELVVECPVENVEHLRAVEENISEI
ncbi:MAG: GIY-YIG nuclease family protein [bacterium]|nr:GIY-YIG nuclease family protein [bacterium]